MGDEFWYRYSKEEKKPKCGMCGAPGGKTKLAEANNGDGWLCELCYHTRPDDPDQAQMNRILNIVVRQIYEVVQACR